MAILCLPSFSPSYLLPPSLPPISSLLSLLSLTSYPPSLPSYPSISASYPSLPSLLLSLLSPPFLPSFSPSYPSIPSLLLSFLSPPFHSLIPFPSPPTFTSISLTIDAEAASLSTDIRVISPALPDHHRIFSCGGEAGSTIACCVSQDRKTSCVNGNGLPLPLVLPRTGLPLEYRGAENRLCIPGQNIDCVSKDTKPLECLRIDYRCVSRDELM
ncbi:hypothetical protein Pcinc_042338 [Petrolisthes cinctipes]|uniref:Uncharacterized protein n=1 Tax=Petrolisthes cinctipes TaxID=88211 RepID=A0AAE1BIZ7_PETCI|nr:hypothetical protein Pcinc_042338 [Petrolisthes cinctipes]